MTAAAGTGFVQYSLEYIGIALLFYDYALTWTREVKYIWTSKLRISTVLYFACRYALVSNVVYLISLAGKLPSAISCDAGYQFSSAFSTIGRAGVLTVLGMRVYALYDRNKYILAMFLSIGVPIIVSDAMHVRLVSCVPSAHGRNLSETLMAILVVVYEVLCAAFVTFRAWQAMRIRNGGKLDRTQLEYLILQQGILYFCFVSIFTFGALVLLYTAPSGSYIQRFLNGLALPISGLMAARFLLYLRECGDRIEGGSEHKVSNPIVFNRSEESMPGDEGDNLEMNNDNGYRERDLIDEFGQDPVRQARMERRNTEDEELALG